MEEERFLEKLKQKRFNRLSNVHIRKYIDIFISLLKTENLRQTCKEKDISLGTASKAINILEEILGSKLFVRKGRKGLLATTEAFKFKEYADKINNVLQITAEAFTGGKIDNADNTNNNQQQQQAKKLIRIACHSLAFQPYILPAIEKIKQKYDIIADFTIIDRDLAMNKLLSNEVDLIMYPIEGRTLAYAERFLKCEYIGEYELCLFFNKKHPLADVPEEKFTWNMIRTLNIEPNNKKFRFTTYEEIINCKYDFSYTIRTADFLALYQGVMNNLWILGVGKEFKKIFNCDNIVYKEGKKMPAFSTKIDWYCMYNNNTYEQTILKELIEDIIIQYNKFKSS